MCSVYAMNTSQKVDLPESIIAYFMHTVQESVFGILRKVKVNWNAKFQLLQETDARMQWVIRVPGSVHMAEERSKLSLQKSMYITNHLCREGGNEWRNWRKVVGLKEGRMQRVMVCKGRYIVWKCLYGTNCYIQWTCDYKTIKNKHRRALRRRSLQTKVLMDDRGEAEEVTRV